MKDYVKIEEVNKFNPYHDAKGRFASANSYTSFTYAPGKSKAHDLAIARQKERASAEKPKTAILDGPSEKVSTYYRKAQGWSGSYYKDDVMEASLSDDGKTLSFSRATGTFTQRSKTGRTVDVEYEIKAGSVNERLVNIDLTNPTLTTVSGNTYKIKDKLKDAGFVYDAATKQYVRGKAQGQSSSGTSSTSSTTANNGHLVIPRGGSLPSDLSGVTRISGNTYANKDQIKAAGFKWDPQSKTWVKPGVTKSADVLLDDEPGIVKIIEI